MGSDKAMLIDTSYGLTDMPQAIRKITALPLLVVNTHGHIDHTHGNHLFDTVFLSHLDNEVFERHNDAQAVFELFKKMIPIPLRPFNWLLWPALKRRIKYSPPVHQPLPKEGYLNWADAGCGLLKRLDIRWDASLYWTKRSGGYSQATLIVLAACCCISRNPPMWKHSEIPSASCVILETYKQACDRAIMDCEFKEDRRDGKKA
ncbi:MBL fold metallo-hydrolase [Paenibacillus sonchi]|uniref:MBL fold metallo-hydrolase n=1 Tax=Paenibacillus sonchi TaxID=373687 RepID=UPI0022779E7B|nr:MBL fold metallo-hydrolase [Paenibacillus sonchi]